MELKLHTRINSTHNMYQKDKNRLNMQNTSHF